MEKTNIGAHGFQNVKQRGARWIQSDIGDGKVAVTSDQGGDNEERGGGDITRDNKHFAVQLNAAADTGHARFKNDICVQFA